MSRELGQGPTPEKLQASADAVAAHEPAVRGAGDVAIDERTGDADAASAEVAASFMSLDDSIGARLRAARPARALHGSLLPDGSRLQGGRIEIVRRLGSGAMGTVYEARDRGTRVALKTLNHLNADQLYRLKREFRFLTEVSHPNVVMVYELLIEEDATWFFTMECLRGQPLDRYWALRRQSDGADAARHYRSEDEPLLRRLLSEISAGVCAIHDAGLLHRDLKPTNMVVEPDGRVVILDFGLVSGQAAGGPGQTIQAQISGTPGYMAPEQAAGLPTTTASDWYAVGVILYQLLTGRLPHSGSLPQLLTAKQRDPVVRPRALVPEIPEELDALCCALLQREPDARPTTEAMRALARTYAASRASAPPRRTQPEAKLFGRDTALARLESLYQRAQRGPVLALVRAESGMGKTELVRAFVDALQRKHDPFVARGRCYEREAVPYKALDEAIDDLTRILVRLPAEQASQLVPRHAQTLTRLFPVLLRVPSFRDAAGSTHTDNPAHLQRLGFLAMRELFGRIADRRPLVLVIDDLHWSDVDSLRLLLEALAPPDPPAFMLLGTCRSGHASAALDELLALGSITKEVIDLEPLGHDEAAALARASLPEGDAQTSGAAARIARESRGHPLYVIELARAGDSHHDDDTLEQLIQRRVRGLPDDARTMLELASVTGRPLPREVLLHACTDVSYPTALATLRAAKLVHCTGASPRDEALEPYHDRVRAAVVSMLEPERLVRHHDALARALETWGLGEAEWLAQHLSGAGRTAEAHRYALRAARKAGEALAFNRAADLFALAITLGGGAPPPALEREQATALACAGRGAEAADAYLRAARALPPDEATQVEGLAATQLLRVGHVAQAVTLLRAVLARRGLRWPETPAECIVRFMLNRVRIRASGLKFTLRPEHEVPRPLLDKLDALYPAHTALGGFDYLRGAYFASTALPLALQAGEPRRLVNTLAGEAIYNVMLDGDAGSARAGGIQDTIDMLAGTLNDAYGAAAAELTGSLCAYWSGHWTRVIAPARRCEQMFNEQVADGTWEATLVRSVRATVALHAGELPHLAREVPSSLLDASDRNDRYAQLDLMRSLVVVHLRDDKLAEADALLREMDELLARFPVVSLNHLVMAINVAAHLYAGRVTEAKACLDERWAQCRSVGLHRFPLLRVTYAGMVADCTLADAARPAEQRAAQLSALAKSTRKEPLAWAGALAAQLEGRAALLSHKPALAQRALTEAEERYTARGMSLPAAAMRQLSAECAAQRRAEELRAEARAFLDAQGVVRPERFLAIVNTIY